LTGRSKRNVNIRMRNTIMHLRRRLSRLILYALCAAGGILQPPDTAAQAPAHAARKPPASPAPPALVARATVKAATRPPRPGSVPYKDAVVSLHLEGARAVKGKLPGKSLLVYVWGMRGNKLTPAAYYKSGQVVTMALTPWEKVEEKYGGYNRREFDDDAVLSLPAYWGEEVRP
jgi:hypothetical protein